MIAPKDLEAAEQDYNDATAESENDSAGAEDLRRDAAGDRDADKQGVPINPQLAVRSPIAA